MKRKKVHLICNAHLDPVWLWQRTEGMAEAVSTFRIAADFCERYDGFVFNHNESVLYEWVQEHEPELFKRIQELVKQGKWRIMGGWYLQPDALMPSGESVVRQIKVGNDFFKKYFGVVPKTSINFDSFGHSRGLVQILKKCGYENYAYVRPREAVSRPFEWVGFDGSSVTALKLYEWYNTHKGKALGRIKNYLEEFPDRDVSALTWGMGNHGGGPSEVDLNQINEFAAECEDTELIHSDFDTYFDELDKSGLEKVTTALTPCMIGCYTSMVRIKQAHRRMENRLSLCEKMLCQSGVDYDKEELKKAEKALLFAEFHDILPGTAIKKAEEDSLHLLGYGDEITDKLIAKSFFKLCGGMEKAKDGEIPVMVYNPHPYEIEADFEVEFQPVNPNYEEFVYDVIMRDEKENIVQSQLEKPDCTMNWDWRKKVVFHAAVKPMTVSRFDCTMTPVYDFEAVKPYEQDDTHIILDGRSTEVRINKATGLIDKYRVDGRDMLKESGIKIKAYRDNEDPWGMTVDGFREYIGEFKLISDKEANEFRGYTEENRPNVTVIENGAVRTKVQAILRYCASYAVVTYTVSKNGKYLDMDIKLLSGDVNTAYKLEFDTLLDENSKVKTQSMFGTDEAAHDGSEIVFQKWCGLQDDKNSFTVLNAGIHGGSAENNVLNLTLLRTPVYSAHPNELDRPIAPHDRVLEHIDLGERDFKFRICANEEFMDCEAEVFSQQPFVLSFFPSGNGEKCQTLAEVNNRNIVMTALKEFDEKLMIRLYNSTNTPQECELMLDGVRLNVRFTPYEVKTFVKHADTIEETNLLGEKTR
mgnify:CR=1 FL=1